MEGGVSSLGRGHPSKALREGGAACGDDGGGGRVPGTGTGSEEGACPEGSRSGGEAALGTRASVCGSTKKGLRGHRTLAWGRRGVVLSERVPRSGRHFKRSIM